MTNQEKPKFTIERLEERIAPSIAPGLQGYEGQPGNQGGGNNNNNNNNNNGPPGNLGS